MFTCRQHSPKEHWLLSDFRIYCLRSTLLQLERSISSLIHLASLSHLRHLEIGRLEVLSASRKGLDAPMAPRQCPICRQSHQGSTRAYHSPPSRISIRSSKVVKIEKSIYGVEVTRPAHAHNVSFCLLHYRLWLLIPDFHPFCLYNSPMFSEHGSLLIHSLFTLSLDNFIIRQI